MAETSGINTIRVISGANQNPTTPLERQRKNNPTDPNVQAPRQQEQIRQTSQDRVNITPEARQRNIVPTPVAQQTTAERVQTERKPQSTPPAAVQSGQPQEPADRRGNQNELNPVRQNENPLNRKIQGVRTNQSPRVRNVGRQFRPGQNAIAQRNQEQEMQARQEDRARFEAGLNQIPGQNPDPQRTTTNPAQADRAGQIPDPQQAIEAPIQSGDRIPQDATAVGSSPADTPANVQRTPAGPENRQETPVVEPPPQNIGQPRLDSQANPSPPTPDVGSRVIQRARAAAEQVQIEQDRASTAREAASQQKEQATNANDPKTSDGPQAPQNRNPAAAQTRVGENIDRLI